MASTNRLQELVGVAGPPLSVDARTFTPGLSPRLQSQLLELLSLRNGFFAFEAALRVFPAGPTLYGYALDEWNAPDLWRAHYNGLADGAFFFAEDLFGGQYGVWEESVIKFDPETADAEIVAADLDGWADLILTDYAFQTGYPLAHEWQLAHGPLEPRQRLVPLTLFVLGGAFSLDNLKAMDAAEGMRVRGPIAQQIRDLPDGSPITLSVEP